MQHTPTAIVSALAEELHAVLALAENVVVHRHAKRNFHAGTLHGLPVVLVLSGVGKVAAATTATLLAERFGVARMVFTGVAGGLGAGVAVGDVVIARHLLQHDMDATPLFPRYEIPLTGTSYFAADAALSDALAQAAAATLAAPQPFGPEAVALGVHASRLHQGLVISGDQFVSSAAASSALRAALPEALAVEMEGAALAQVCHDLGLPCAVLRTVSDRADDSAHVDFVQFIHTVAAKASAAVVSRWLLAYRG